MVKRPLCLYVCLFLLFLVLIQAAGVPDERSAVLEKNRLGEQLIASGDSETTTDVLGRIYKKQESVHGERIYLSDFSVIRSDVLSNNISNSKFFIIAYMNGKIPADFNCGDVVVVRGVCMVPDPVSNIGQYDMNLYLEQQRVLFLMTKSVILKRAKQTTAEGIARKVYGHLENSFDSICGSDDAALMRAIALGEKEMIPAELKSIYKEGGALHITAVSGLHIGLIGMSVWKILRKRRHSFIFSGAFSSMILFLYCLMTGMSVSALRAFVMFVVWTLAQILGRTNDRLTAVAAGAFVCALRNPACIRDGGFYLSFSCILALALIGPVLKKRAERRKAHGKIGRFLNRLYRLCIPSIAVQLGTLPVSAYFFYQITPWSFLTNLIVLPCMSVLLAAGMTGCVLGTFSTALGTLAAAPCHYLLSIFKTLCMLERYLPYSVFVTGKPALWQIAAYYFCAAVVFYALNREDHRPLMSCSWTPFFGLSAAVFVLLLRPPVPFRLIAEDVGQGNGVFIHVEKFPHPALNIMIDCGSSTRSHSYTYAMESTLKSLGVRRLDYVFATHGDADHTNGISELLEESKMTLTGPDSGGISIGCLAVTAAFESSGQAAAVDETLAELMEKAQNAGILVGRIRAGESILYGSGDLRLTCLYPEKQDVTEELNQNSLVFMLNYKGFRVLLTGDNEKDGEKTLTERYGSNLKADVLQTGHHGSKNATSEEFLDAVEPDIALISCGRNNRYGHPAGETLERLDKAGVDVFRTDRDGAILLEDENGKMILRTADDF